jgi:lambda repressor-like predicted transcriptional regulator
MMEISAGNIRSYPEILSLAEEKFVKLPNNLIHGNTLISVLFVTYHDHIFEQFPSQKRRRGVILSSQGWQKLHPAENLSATRDNGSNPYILEQLSERTGLSCKTLAKVRRRSSSSDQLVLVLAPLDNLVKHR